jgi:hypothetical protein
MMSNKQDPRTMLDRGLSKVSRNYDLGGKGFLTDTEQQMRGMDDDNLGHLNNAQVSEIVAETLALREKTGRMKMWLGILGVFVIVLGLSNLGTAFAAAWLAKDTTVNESTGQLLVKGSDIPVTVQSTGQTAYLVLEEMNSFTQQQQYGCMPREDAATLWNGVLNGTASAITIQEASQQDDADADPSLQAFFALALTTNGATWNETMACMPVSDGSGGKVCIDFTDNRCDADSSSTPDRALEVIDHHTRRQLFHAARQGNGGRVLSSDEGTGVSISVLANVATSVPEAPPTATVNLGTAENYVILAKSGITTVPASVITGDIAVSPIAGTFMTGFSFFPMESGGTFSSSSQITGMAFAADYAVPTPALLTTAVGDMQTAFTDAAGRGPAVGPRLNLGSGILGGDFGGPTAPLTTGVYTFGTGVTIASTIYFEGSDTDVFIIQMAGNLVQAANTNVILNGARAENIFWKVSGNVNVLAGAHLEGILLVQTDVTFVTGSSLYGRVLAQTACALQKATITQPLLE